MQSSTYTHHDRFHMFKAAGMLLVFAFVLLSASSLVSGAVMTAADATSQTYRAGVQYTQSAKPEFDVLAAKYRMAYRLQERLKIREKPVPPVQELVKALNKRQVLLNNKTTVYIQTEDNEHYYEWNVSLAEHPSWAPFVLTAYTADAQISQSVIEDYLSDNSVDGIEYPTDVILSDVLVVDGIHRAQVAGIAQSGYEFDAKETADAMVNAFERGVSAIHVRLHYREGRVINQSGYDLGNLDHIATGKSNFRGSTWGRKQNVKKALNEHVHNTVVAPGETFSFNDLLGGPVNTYNGWVMAKVIFNGTELRPAPGGGICQASTTVFRAVANAGFPLVDHKNHSIYVHYYEKYGVGLDATIYPGSQDLSFINDSENYLVIQAYNDGDDAYVNLYGTDDGRRVDLQGPYFSTNAPEDFLYNGRKLYRNEVAWVQKVVYADGETKEETIVSRYLKGIPSRVINKHTLAQM